MHPSQVWPRALPLQCLVPLLATALGLSLLGSLGGLLVASSLLIFSDSLRTRLVPWLVSYAVGALLAVAPPAREGSGSNQTRQRQRRQHDAAIAHEQHAGSR